MKQYEPVVLSRPSYAPGDDAQNAGYEIGLWMVLFENAVSETEADRLVELGGDIGYATSSNVLVEARADGTHEQVIDPRRTSTNAWCVDDCYNDPAAQAIMMRIVNVTAIPEANYEYLQLVRYEVGQFFRNHHDYVPHQKDLPCGVRILTFFIYLNDVEEGGGTRFEHLGRTVTPRKGRAILWPSVIDASPNEMDRRSYHEALPVVRGVKYGANAWIHQRDYKASLERGCT